MDLQLVPQWETFLKKELTKPYFSEIINQVNQSYTKGIVFPAAENIFNAFNTCPPSDVKVVILGQDPYHGDKQAHGLSFSVPDGVKLPPSLRNIYKEIESDIGQVPAVSGNLENWASQGILLLNATLTVEAGNPGSHQNLGWETFTDGVIRTISNERKYVVFLLWGKFAQAKAKLIDSQKHLILTAPHPSPFSAHRGFLGCKHFSKTNAYLKSHGLRVVEW